MARKKTRTQLAPIALTPLEKKTFHQLAKSRGMDFSNFVRQLLYRELKLDKQEGAA